MTEHNNKGATCERKSPEAFVHELGTDSLSLFPGKHRHWCKSHTHDLCTIDGHRCEQDMTNDRCPLSSHKGQRVVARDAEGVDQVSFCRLTKSEQIDFSYRCPIRIAFLSDHDTACHRISGT